MSYLDEIRSSYDTVAADYADLLRDFLAANPYDRAVLAMFAELVGGAEPVSGGAIADIGCGPGRLTPHLAGLGLDVFGIDLSPQMVAVARREHPGLRFEVGSMTALSQGDATLAGLLAWYSTIHLPDTALPVVCAEFARVLAPGGYALLAFQANAEAYHLDHAYGHDLNLDVHCRAPEQVEALLEAAGLRVEARLVRAPADWEKTPHAYLIARKPADSLR